MLTVKLRYPLFQFISVKYDCQVENKNSVVLSQMEVNFVKSLLGYYYDYLNIVMVERTLST